MTGTSKSFQVNDKVVFLHENGGGIITRIEGGHYFVLDETGFERPFLACHLSPLIRSMNKINFIDATKVEGEKSNSLTRSQQAEIPTIDLHIEQLVDNHSNWTNHEIITYQLRAFRTFLDKCILQKSNRVVVIHGMGNGRLKEEIRIYLKGHKRYQFQDADFSKFGFGGATQIDIKLNWKG